MASTDFASLHVGTDYLRFVQFPAPIQDGAESVIKAAWRSGVASRERAHWTACQYTLNGKPCFTGRGSPSAQSRLLVRSVLAYLYENGWIVCASLTLGTSALAKDSIIFKKKSDDGGIDLSPVPIPFTTPPAVNWLTMGVAGGNRLCIALGCGENSQTTYRDRELVEALCSGFENLAMKCLRTVANGELEFAFPLVLNLWEPQTLRDTVMAETLVLQRIEVVTSQGWVSYCTVQHRSHSGTRQKLDTWFFIQESDWVMGSPFNSEPGALLGD